MIKQLLNSVIAKYRDLSMASRSIIHLLAIDKSRYFAQPRPIIVNSVLATRTRLCSTTRSTLHIIPKLNVARRTKLR